MREKPARDILACAAAATCLSGDSAPRNDEAWAEMIMQKASTVTHLLCSATPSSSIWTLYSSSSPSHPLMEELAPWFTPQCTGVNNDLHQYVWGSVEIVYKIYVQNLRLNLFLVALISNLWAIPPPVSQKHTQKTLRISHPSAGAHWHTYAKLMKLNSPRSLITWLSFHPERSPKRLKRETDRGRMRARKSSPGAESCVLIQSVHSCGEGGDQAPWSLVTISIPHVSRLCSLSWLILVLTCFYKWHKTDTKTRRGNRGEVQEIHMRIGVRQGYSSPVTMQDYCLRVSAIWCYW